MNAITNLLLNLFLMLGSEAVAVAHRMASFPGFPMRRRLGGEDNIDFFRRCVTRLAIMVSVTSAILIVVGVGLGSVEEGLKPFFMVLLTLLTLFFLGRLYIAGIPAILGIEMFIPGSQIKQYTRGALGVATGIALVAIIVAITPFHESWNLLWYAVLFGIVGTIGTLSGKRALSKFGFVSLAVIVAGLTLFTPETRDSFSKLGERVQVRAANTINCVSNNTTGCVDEDKRPIEVPQGTTTAVTANFFPKHGLESAENDQLCSSGDTEISLRAGDNWERVHNPNAAICALRVDWDLSLPHVTRSMNGSDLVWLPSNHPAYTRHEMPSARWHEFHLPILVRPASR